MSSDQRDESNSAAPDQLPFVAPCKILDIDAPFRWLSLGWRDFKAAPKPSLTYGSVILILSYLISFLALKFGNLYSLLALMSGFILLGPIIAIGLYSISCQLQEGKTPVLGYCLREGAKHIGNIILFGFMLLVVFLIWARAASMLHVFYPVDTSAGLNDFIMFLGIGSLVGSVFAAIIFCASAFSLPMIMDRRVDMITAVITSINAVLRNKKVMLLWAMTIVFSVLLSFLTVFIGFVVLLPIIGHATWHAYQETIDASAWPRYD